MDNSIEQVGMPQGGDVLVREQMLSEVGERMFDGRGDVDVMAQLRQQEAQQRERAQRVTALRSAVLRGYDEDFKGDARFFSEYEYLNSERARSDSKGFNMLLGGELSRVLANGNTYGVLRFTIDGLPKEQQQGAMERMRACKTEQEGKELLGELWGNGIKREWKEQKEQLERVRAEQEEQLAQLRESMEEKQREAQDLVGNALEDFWVYSVLDNEADLPERALYWWDDAGYGEDSLEGLRATHRRAANAVDKLYKTQYGMSRRALRAWVKEEAARREDTWRKRGHFSLSGELEVPSDEVFKREALESASENFDVSREAIMQINELLKDDDGVLDERAVVLFAQALKKEAELMQGVRDGFWDNYFGRLMEWGDESGDFIRRAWGSDEMYNAEVEKIKGMLAIAEEYRLAPGEGAGALSRGLTYLGSAAGGTTPMMAASMVPYVGKYLKYAANAPTLINQHIADNYLENKPSPKLEAWIQGSFESVAEASFMSALHKLPLSGKLMDWVGLKTVSVPAIGKAVGKVQGNAFLRVGTGWGMEFAGEMVVEDLVAETGTHFTIKVLRELGVDFKEREWKPFEGAWKQMQDPAQAGATAAFCASLGMLGIPANIRAAREFAANRDILYKAGLSERSIAEVSSEHAKFRKALADKVEAEREHLQKVREEAEKKAVAKAENKEGRPLSYAEVADLRQEAGDAAVQKEVDKMADVLQEPLNKTMRVAYERDVLLVDPLEVKKRMLARHAEVLKDIEVQLYVESGVRDYVLQQSGMLVSDKPNEDGLYTVQVPKGEQMVEMHWTEEQLNAFVATQHKSAQVKLMRELQSRLAGTAVAEAAAQHGADGVRGMLVNMRTLPKRAIARMERTGWRMNYFVLQDLAADARECVEGFVEGGMSVSDALGQMSVVPGVSLGTLMQSATAFLHRVESLIGSEEGMQLGIQKVDDASTAVMRLDATAPGQSVLLYNKGLATEREIVEDLIERDVVAAAEGDGAVTSLAALKTMLLHVEDELVKHGGKRFVPNGKAAGRQDVIEGFARLGQSHFLLKHSQYDMSEQAHNTIEYVQKKLADTQHLVALSKAWDAFANSEEGRAYIEKEGATLERLLSDAGASVAGHYAAAKFNAEALHAVKEAYEGSFRSLEAAHELMAEYEAEQKALDHPAEESVVEVVAAEESVTGEELRIEPEAAVDDETGDFVVPAGAEVVADAADKGRGLVGGNYVEMADGSVYGVALVEDITLSTDVPQFKKKESAAGRVDADEDGTTHELAGGWNGNSAPIHVWRRLDGRLEVISGRHRLAHAKKNGVKHIAVRVYDESAGHDARWAKLHDVEQNILDNTCNAIDVAYYFRNNPLTLGEAEARGLMPKTRAGEQTAASRIGLMVAAYASDDTFTMLVNGQCSAEDAYMACLVAEDAEGQQLALQTRLGGKGGKKASWEYVTALVRGAQQMRPADGGGMLDLFGNDESFRVAAEKQARYVAAVRAGLKARLNVLTSAGRLNKKGAVSKEMGVKVKTPKDLNKLVARIAQLDAAYERLDYELGIPARAEAWDGKSAVPTKLEALEGKGGSFSVQGMTPEMVEIKSAALADGTFMKAPNGKDSKLNERQWLQVRTRAFKDWFGDWENDPENASKVVDENGEPLVVYHGTERPVAFSVFKGGKSGYLGPGIYFTPELRIAHQYRGFHDPENGMVYSCFVNIRKPLRISYAEKPAKVILDMVSKTAYESRAAVQANESKMLRKGDLSKVKRKGYDGIVWLPKVAYDTNSFTSGEMLLFDSTQIKSATDNRGTFDGSNGDITYSLNGNLAAVHSLSAEKFLSALELGGMPLPSVAVTRLDKPYSWGGADGIALVGRPEMVDPKKRSKVYMHDAYTGTMPPVMYRKKNTDSLEKLKADMTDKMEVYGMASYVNGGIFSNDYNESVIDRYSVEQWRNNCAMMAYWAITQAGYTPKPKMKEMAAEGMNADLHKVLKPLIAQLPKEGAFSYDYTDELLEEFRDVMCTYWEGKGKPKIAAVYRDADAKDLQSRAHNLLSKYRYFSTEKVPDSVENAEVFERYVRRRKKAYEAWMAEQMRKFVGEKVFSRKYVRRNWRGEVVDEWWGHEAFNLKNLTRYMREEKGRGEESASMSQGVFLAYVSEELRSLKDMQARRERVVDSNAHQEAREEWQKEWDKFNKLAYGLKKPGWGSYFEIADSALWRLLELVQGGKNMPSREAVEKKLNESKDGWTDEHVDAAMDLLSKALTMSSDYMEAVPQRAVKMDEWEYAVMPVALKKNKAVMAGLRENGIKPRFHDGTEEGRKAALAGLVGDDKVSFSVIGQNAATWDKYADRAFKGRDDGMLRAEALVTFSLASVSAEWECTLDGYLRNRPQPGTPDHTRDLVVCPTPAVMQMVGAKGWDMVVTPGVLDKVMRGKHAVSEEALRQLPAALAAPVCIAVSDTPGCLEVVTELKEGEHNVLVAVQLNSEHSSLYKVKVNRIASMYGKERIASLLNHPMLYWDKAKARPWVNNYRLQLPAPIQPRRASGRRIQTPADLVKYKLQSGLSFSIRGRDMLTEAPLGRMAAEEKMQRLMNYARKEAARWERTFGAEKPNARAAEAMGTISSIMGAIHKELPPKFRPRLDGQMRYVEVYARLLESGKVRAYGKLKKAEREAVEAELLETLREDVARVEEEYERAKMEALDAAELTGEMDALEAAGEMDAADEVKRAAYLERLAKRSAAEARKRLLADLEVKKRALDAEVEELKRGFAAEKLGRIAGRMLRDAADAVEQYLIAEELEAVDFLRERLAPKKLPNGKFDKGKMSADAYRQFVKFTEMMDMSADEVAMRMQELGQQIASEEGRSDDERGDDGEKLDQLTDELAALSTYGGLRGRKNLETVRKGVAALTKFAENERNAWSGVLELLRARAKRQARICAEALGGATSQQLADNKEKVNKTLGKIRGLSSYMKSLAQVFYGMGRVPELRVLADESLEALSRGHVQLSLREKRAYEQIAKHMETMGLKTERQRNDWMEELKKKHDTGIMLEGKWQTHTLRLSPLEAAEWLEMSKAEREKKRKAMLEAAEKQDKVDAKNVVYEEDIPLLRAKYDEYLKKPGGRKWITTRRDFQLPAPKESLKISKDEALNILLLCEYGDYLDAAYLNGYTDEVLSQLTDFVGSDVLGYGYAMRAILESSGLAEVYEAREGVPFPKVNNYWPGSSFDQSARSTEVDPLDPTVGNGTRHGMLISRVKHRLDFEYLGASNVFLAALAQQNNYIVMGELTAKWRQLLSHNDFARALRKHLGEVGFSKFKELINLLDGAGVMESITQKTLSSLMSKFQSAHAMAVLAWAPITLVKQLSAFTNAAAWGGGSISRILYHIVRDRVGGGAIKYGDMMRKDYFQARYKDNRYFTEMLGLPRNAKWSRWSTLARTGMGLIEKTDVIANCFSMTALYNMTYADLKKANREAADPLTEEQMHAACDRVVRNALELGAQPLRRTQKSAWGALANNAVVKATCYMSTETINKIGMALALGKRKGGGWGAVNGWWYLARISALQQCIVMILDLMRNANPEEEEEWQKWLLLNFVTGASGLGVLQSMPILGEVLENATSGYVKTGSLGNMVFDFSGALRGVTDAFKLATFDITEDVKAKRTSEHDFYVISYKKFNGTVVERKTDVPKDGGMYKGEYLTKEKAEEKALEVGKELALEDAPGVDDWFMCGANLLRVSAAFSGAGNGINSTSKFVSEFSGFLQSLNALANAVRPFMQASRNKEKQEDAKMKAERKRKQEERKAKREAEKEKKKRRSEMLNRG